MSEGNGLKITVSQNAEHAVEYDGPERALTDARQLSVGARFCDPDGTVWKLVSRADDESVRQLFGGMVGNCPSGRLISWNRRSAEAIEPTRDPSIGVIEDPVLGVSGPLWVTGEIQIQSGFDGHGCADEPLSMRPVGEQATLRRHARDDRPPRRLLARRLGAQRGSWPAAVGPTAVTQGRNCF